jgi:hypothetical protein
MTVSVIVNLPPHRVFPLFIDPGFYREWKKDFVGFEPAVGLKGQVGSVCKLAFKQGLIVESIESNNAPYEFSAIYTHLRGVNVQMVHRVTNRFSETSSASTRIDSDMEVVEVNGFLRKFIVSVFVKAGTKYAQNQLEKFRIFAESQPHI